MHADPSSWGEFFSGITTTSSSDYSKYASRTQEQTARVLVKQQRQIAAAVVKVQGEKDHTPAADQGSKVG